MAATSKCISAHHHGVLSMSGGHFPNQCHISITAAKADVGSGTKFWPCHKDNIEMGPKRSIHLQAKKSQRPTKNSVKGKMANGRQNGDGNNKHR